MKVQDKRLTHYTTAFGLYADDCDCRTCRDTIRRLDHGLRCDQSGMLIGPSVQDSPLVN